MKKTITDIFKPIDYRARLPLFDAKRSTWLSNWPPELPSSCTKIMERMFSATTVWVRATPKATIVVTNIPARKF